MPLVEGECKKPSCVDQGVQCNIIDDKSCHSCIKMEEKYLNEIYQLSGWVARHCFCAFQCSKTSKHIRFEV